MKAVVWGANGAMGKLIRKQPGKGAVKPLFAQPLTLLLKKTHLIDIYSTI